MVIAADLGKALLARVRASRAPHDDALAGQVRLAHDHLRENQGRVLMTVGQFAAPLVFVPAFYLSLPLFVGLLGASVFGAGRVVARSRRRTEEVRELGRNARVASARAIPNGTNLPGIAAYETERRAYANLRIEIRDGDRTFTARLVRERPRGFTSVSVDRITVLYAPLSSIVIAFDMRGEMILGTVESEPLPRARLV
jgi:hypothetical protein